MTQLAGLLEDRLLEGIDDGLDGGIVGGHETAGHAGPTLVVDELAEAPGSTEPSLASGFLLG